MKVMFIFDEECNGYIDIASYYNVLAVYGI